jgi:hypothetical protein
VHPEAAGTGNESAIDVEKKQFQEVKFQHLQAMEKCGQ